MKISKVIHIHDPLLFVISGLCSNYSRRMRSISLVVVSLNFGVTIEKHDTHGPGLLISGLVSVVKQIVLQHIEFHKDGGF